MIDYHIHTSHSIDAEGTIREYCERALQLGLKEICFTNHGELDPARSDNLIKFTDVKLPLTKANLTKLHDETFAAKEFYKKHGLLVRFGLEIGYYEGMEKRLREVLDDINFDFLLGSIHCLDHVCIDSSKEYLTYFSECKADKLLDKYFQTLEKLVACGLFDAVGHLDVYKKYGLNFYGEVIKTLPEDSLRKIFQLMMEKETALEINTAGLRRINQFYPSPDFMKLARAQGVKMLTIGSDCHNLKDLGKGIDEGLEYAKSSGFDAVYGYEKRRPIRVKI